MCSIVNLLSNFKDSTQFLIAIVIQLCHQMFYLVVIPGMVLLIQREQGGEYGGKDDGIEPAMVRLRWFIVVRHIWPDSVSLALHEHAQVSPGLSRQHILVHTDYAGTKFPGKARKYNNYLVPKTTLQRNHQ